VDGAVDAPRAEDERAVVALTVAYAWAIDTKRFEDLRDVFAPSATADLVRDCPTVDDIVAWVSAVLQPLDASQHLVTNHQVSVDGERAACRCQVQAQHVRRGAEGGSTYVVGGHYEDDVVRTPEGWRLAHRRLVVTWTSGNPRVLRP
jgi:hypothetical protein